MRFQVPQFTDVEDKIIGPLTFKQFVYMAGAAGMIIVLFTLLPKFLAILLALPIAALGGLLAFYKVNNQPFIRMVEAFLKFHLTNKLYLWKHEEKNPSASASASAAAMGASRKPLDPSLVPKLSESKLRDMMWTLDVKNSQNPTGGEE